jgi:hypothetical protein
MGYSHRRETSDGATAAKLRLNAFTQLELQLIHAEDTKAEIATPLRECLVPVVSRITGLETRLVASDRLPHGQTFEGLMSTRPSTILVYLFTPLLFVGFFFCSTGIAEVVVEPCDRR